MLPLIACIVFIYFSFGEFRPIFRQQRLGLNQRPFTIYKFRSIYPVQAKRKGKWGSWLRYLSLDEIPQLVNVLRGDMSIVGPRPLPVQYDSKFDIHQHRRHHVKPGLTGWAQVNGRKTLSLPEKIEFDIYYIERISFLFDLKIMISTYRVLFHPLNAEER